MEASGAAPRPGEAARRPGGGMKWSEVCERVQQPDGSVRTSPRIRSGIAAGGSPPRPRPHSQVGKLGRISCSGAVSVPAIPSSSVQASGSSLGGSSRGGSSGKSSRSSSRDQGRDGDISSRASSGCWDTSTNSSENSRPRTPPDVAPSPSGSKALLMPDPIRTGLMLPPALLDDENASNNKDDANCGEEVVDTTTNNTDYNQEEPRPGMTFKWDPYGRDVPRRSEVKGDWSVEPLAKYLKRVVQQIDANIQNHRLPTAEKLDAFVSRLVSNTHRQLKHAPKKFRHTLQAMLSHRFKRFWNFTRNEKVRTTNPEELKSTLIYLIDALVSEFAVCPDAELEADRGRSRSEALEAPQPGRHSQHHMLVDTRG